ncbi:discoidin domain-containing protein [Akkermansiaceae bacterium]|nr:discoidin domain-containing protein [Akkermansiaceae bacterium]MDA9831484.1 discoidin domain-containing protein [Akkermansiaceae bacterium]MDB4465631.1 discoidin domain-containing protein [Akkermansiaceae bacterium]
MSLTFIRTAIGAALLSPALTFGGVTGVLLTPDGPNSSPNSFGGSLEKTLDDPFDYDAEAPEINLPNRIYNNGSIGYHANLGEGVDALLSYTTAITIINSDEAELVVDLYGRVDNVCCNDRDDNIDVQLFQGSFDTPIAAITGVMIDNAGSGWARATFDELPVGTRFDRIRIVGRDSGGGAANNYFTLLELRAAIITPDIDDDNDGLPDDWEVANGISPDDDGTVDPNNGPGGDPDSDNLSNLAEFENRTDPLDDDSDDDTLKDGDEVAGAGNRPATDPLNPDTDGDTLSDLVETNTGTFASASDTGTNPTLTDSDLDSTPDQEEVGRGTDPNDPESGGNLAIGKVAGYFDGTGTPTATWAAFPAANINDGDLTTITHGLSISSPDHYFEIDLAADNSISHVIITGRGFRDDCCADRLENATLSIVNSTGTEVYRQELSGQIIMSQEVDLSAAPPFGQFVRIINTSANEYGPQLGELSIVGSSAPPAALVISEIEADPDSGAVSLTWNSQPGAVYSVFGSEDLLITSELNDSVASQGPTTTYSFNNPEMIGKSRYFYRIQRN